MTANARVIRNILMVIASEGVGGMLSFAVVLIAARILGVADFGVFSYILALTGVSQLIADFGLTNLIVRELVKDKGRAKYIMSNVLSLAWVLALGMFSVIAIASLLTLETREEVISALLMGFAVLAIYHSVVYSSVCRAYERMEYNSVFFVIHKILLIGFIYLFTGPAAFSSSTMISIASAYLLANLAQYIYFWWIVRSRFIKFGFGKNVSFCRYLIKEAMPIGASMVLRRMTLHVDVVVLTFLGTTVAVGIFSAGYKVIQLVDMIPLALCLPLFPAMTRLAAEDHEKLREFLFKTLDIFLMASTVLAGYLLIFADPIVATLYGEEYQQAAVILKILSVTVVGLFVNTLLSYLFMALDRRALYLSAVGTCLLVNLVVDLSLVPFLHERGAAIGTLSAELAYFCVCLIGLSKARFSYPWVARIVRPLLVVVVGSLLLNMLVPTSTFELVLFSAGYFVFCLIGLFVVGSLDRHFLTSIFAALKAGRDSPPVSS